MPIKRDLTGMKFGKLTVIRLSTTGVRTHWECKCDCGNHTKIRHLHLIRNRIMSCGCRIGERHGMSHSKIYNVWRMMIERCHKSYASESDKKNYQDREIKVCAEWRKSFKSFYSWCIEKGYSDGLQIDRIDNDKGYSPENCRWVTREVNMNNMRSNNRIEYKGTVLNLSQWAERYNLPINTLRNRLFILKWDKDRAFNTQSQSRSHVMAT